MTINKMYGVSAPNTDVSEVGEGYWTQISARFARETKGDAYSLCSDADETRIFSRDELKNWMDAVNDSKKMNGITRAELSKLSGTARFERVREAARCDLRETGISLQLTPTSDGGHYISKTGRDFTGSSIEKTIPTSTIDPTHIFMKSGEYTKVSDVFIEIEELGTKLDKSEDNIKKILSIISKTGGKTEDAVKAIKVANFNLDTTIKGLSKPLTLLRKVVTKDEMKKLSAGGIKFKHTATSDGKFVVAFSPDVKKVVDALLTKGLHI
jgi:hypothetical protein